MKKLATVLTLLLVLSLCLAAVAPVALADDVRPATDERAPEPVHGVINWTPTSLMLFLTPGESERAVARFTSNQVIQGATVVVTLPLSRYVTVAPREFRTITPGTEYEVVLTARLPEVTAEAEENLDVWIPPVVFGLVQITTPGRVYSWPLSVTIVRTSTRPPIQWTPSKVNMFVDLSPTASATQAFTTTVVSFTTAYTLTNVRIRADAPLNRFLDVEPSGPLTLVPGITYTVQLTAHPAVNTATVPDADAALENGDWSSARQVVSGLVEVFDAQRVYPQHLAVVVTLTPIPTPAVVVWHPPLVSLWLRPGETATRIVTLTSNITIENPTLRDTGPLSPNLTAEFQPAVTRILPRTPVPVRLTLTSPASPTINRLTWGEVSVVGGDGRVHKFPLKVTVLWIRAGVTEPTQ